jgi:hypothetical protein
MLPSSDNHRAPARFQRTEHKIRQGIYQEAVVVIELNSVAGGMGTSRRRLWCQGAGKYWSGGAVATIHWPGSCRPGQPLLPSTIRNRKTPHQSGKGCTSVVYARQAAMLSGETFRGLQIATRIAPQPIPVWTAKCPKVLARRFPFAPGTFLYDRRSWSRKPRPTRRK